jgi:anhydro-N-acetylmuramic acid kinase
MPNGSTEMIALGLMSGTSLDGIDAALLVTDGRGKIVPGHFMTVPYDARLRERIRSILGGEGAVAEIEQEVTEAHISVVRELLSAAALEPEDVGVIGFHGHTILHDPEQGRTWQIGDGGRLARESGIDVVCDMRANDVAHGGEGAPLAPLYHAALCHPIEQRPLAVLNIGGVANLTWIGEGEADIIAFDTGPGGALLDDWVVAMTGGAFDRDGVLARAGHVRAHALERLLDNPWFDRAPPKSLDRDDFGTGPVLGLDAADGAATLVAFTCDAVARSVDHLPSPPARWLVTGGGRHNPAIMEELAKRLDGLVEPVEAVGWNGDMLEAQAFAYLAARCLEGLPLTLPTTTGVSKPLSGGVICRA